MAIACLTSAHRSFHPVAGDLFAGSDIFFWNFLELPPVQMAGPAGAHSANKKKFTEFGGGGTNIGENTERWGLVRFLHGNLEANQRLFGDFGVSQGKRSCA